MDVTIEQHLENISQRLQQDKDTVELGYDIASFSRQFTNLMVKLRQCQEVYPNVNKAITFLPEGEKMAQLAGSTFERYGLWTAERKEISDRLDKILTAENILNEFVDSLLIGCECRKGPKRRASLDECLTYSYSEVVERARKAGLDTSGGKVEMCRRLIEAGAL